MRLAVAGLLPFVLLVSAAPAFGQSDPAAPAGGEAPAREEAPGAEKAPDPSRRSPELEAWREVAQQARLSQLDYVRALEEFLERFPETARRAEIERSLLQSAIELGDRRRIVLYGERVLEREPRHVQLAEYVIRALLEKDDPDRAERALKYARQFLTTLQVLELQQPSGGSKLLAARERLDRAVAKAYVFQARALGNLGRTEEALKLARASFERYPTAEAARETGRWLARVGRPMEAAERYAEAFVIDDPDNTAELRAGDVRRMRELYREAHGSEEGLGDLVLAAYERTREALEARRAELKKLVPNLDAAHVFDFVLSGLDGARLELGALRGKVIVLDFWATWCRPCRELHRLMGEVKQRYADRDDVVFVSVNTDIDRGLVRPFLAEAGWKEPVYFEDGLERFLEVTNIPTIIVIDKQGEIVSRIPGLVTGKFVELLAHRIDRALEAD